MSSDAFAEEKLKTMRAFGADLTIVPSENGQITPDLIPRIMAKAAEYAQEPNTYWTNQMNNADSLVGYRGVGDELLNRWTDRLLCSVRPSVLRDWPWVSRLHLPTGAPTPGS